MIYYQPQFTLAGRTLAGLEALVRWQHPTVGWISPAEFVPVAEQSSLITELDNWMLQAVFGQIGRWRRAGAKPPRIAVNVSAQQFRSDMFVGLANRLMNQAGRDRPEITLELTETVFLSHHADEVNAIFTHLRQAGYELALDDFGTGYSSLGYLRNIPIQELKIDASFIRDIDSNDRARKLVTGITSLGHSLGLRIVAEGVETEAERSCLEALGCDLAQGFLFARPQPAGQTIELLNASGGSLNSVTPSEMLAVL
jgi:EAL domain-containing protein (putative c-di-GMP-specific phosphodiesterase class I)